MVDGTIVGSEISIDSFKVASSERTACSVAIKLSSLVLPASERFNFYSVVAGWTAPSPVEDACTFEHELLDSYDD